MGAKIIRIMVFLLIPLHYKFEILYSFSSGVTKGKNIINLNGKATHRDQHFN